MIVRDLKLEEFGGGSAWTWLSGEWAYSLRLGSKGPLVNRRKGESVDRLWWRDGDEDKETVWFPGKSDADPRWHRMPYIRSGKEEDRALLLEFLESV